MQNLNVGVRDGRDARCLRCERNRMRPAQVGKQVAQMLGDPRYMYGVAYGFRNESDILPLDLTYDPKSTAIPRTR